MLGAAQEAWLFDELRSSQRAGTAWRLLGQQVLFARVTPPGWPVLSSDLWDGYQAARDRVLDFLANEGVRDVAISERRPSQLVGARYRSRSLEAVSTCDWRGIAGR